MENISVRQFIRNYEAGKYDDPSVETMIEAGWFDWFCDDGQLKERLDGLFHKVTQLAHTSKIDMDKMYVFFKNNCPAAGDLYDDFRFCDLKTGDVVYTVIPSSGHTRHQGLAELWGRENDFERALVTGTWADIKEFFGGPAW